MTIIDGFLKTKEGKKLLHQEANSLELTDKIYSLMKRKNISKGKIANILNIRVKDVNNVLEGNFNFRLLSDILWVLGVRLKIEFTELEERYR